MARSALRVSTVLWIVLTTAAIAQDTSPPSAESSAPELQLTVNLVRDSLRPGDSVPVDLWLANSSPVALSGIELHVQGPGFLSIGDPECDRAAGSRTPEAPEPAVDLGPLPPDQSLRRRLHLCAGKRIQEGDFHLLFVVQYRWTVDGRERSSFTAVEKTLRAALLGTGSLGGLSFGLIAFVLPGLLFWLVLRLFKVPYTTDLSSTESAALSVLTSALLIAVLSAWGPGGESSSISVGKLGLLCLMGALPALVLGLIVFGVRRRRARRENEAAIRKREAIIRKTDGMPDILRKVLAQGPPGAGKNVFVKVKTDDERIEEWVGSACGESGDGQMVLVGWYQVRRPGAFGSDPARGAVDEVTELLSRREFHRALERAVAAGLTVEIRDAIRRQDEDGNLSMSPESFLFFPSNEVVASDETDAGPRLTDPITMA